MAILVQLSKDGIIQRMVIDHLPVTIGRHPDNEFVVDDTRISRQHARIEMQAGLLNLVDLNSTHRTYINSEELSGGLVLAHGDRISLAKKVDLLYLESEDPAVLEECLRDIRHRHGLFPPDPYSSHVSRKIDEILGTVHTSGGEEDVLQRVNDEVKRSVLELQCLYEIGNAINSELDLEKVLELILHHVLRATRGERGFILLRDPVEEKVLVPVTAMGMDGHLDPDERLKFSTSIATEALERKKCIVSRDADLDPEKQTQSIVALGIRWSICAPLLSKGRAIGVLYVDAIETRRRFSEKDVDFFSALANQSAIAIENAQLYQELTASVQKLDRKVQELTALYSISKCLMNTSDLDGVLATVLDKSIETIGTERGSIMLRADGEDALEVKVIRGQFVDPAIQDRIRIRAGEGIAGRVLETGQGLIDNQGSRSPRFEPRAGRERDVHQILCVPLASSKETLGVINLVNKTGSREFMQDDLDLMTSIASQAAVTIENTRLYDLAVYDGLTRVFIRRYFDAWLTKELERAKRYASLISVILVDIDHFKYVNDTYGHQTGDVVLVELAKIFKDSARACDVVARYGGEEFIVGLPDTGLEGAALLAERLRQTVEAREIHHQDHTLNFTISAGVACAEQGDAPNMKQLVKSADIALYEAKGTGRNRVRAYRSGEGDSEP